MNGTAVGGGGWKTGGEVRGGRRVPHLLGYSAGLFAVSTFAYASFSTMALVLPSDLYPSGSVATVSGMSGTGAGVGTIISTYLIGYVSDRYSFEPILITASLIPLVGMVLVLLLVRNRRPARDQAAA